MQTNTLCYNHNMKSIDLYEGKYTLYSNGTVVSHSRKAHRYIEAEINGKINPAGYKQIILYDMNSKRHYVLVHRLVAKYFVPNPNNYRVVNHKDGNKLNNDVSNLEWCTDHDNQIHARDTLKVYDNKLSFEKAEEIRKLYSSGNYSGAKLAKMYGIGKTMVYSVIHYKRWSK